MHVCLFCVFFFFFCMQSLQFRQQHLHFHLCPTDTLSLAATTSGVNIFSTLHHSYPERWGMAISWKNPKIQRVKWLTYTIVKHIFCDLCCLTSFTVMTCKSFKRNVVLVIFWYGKQKDSDFHLFLFCLRRKMTRKSHTRRVLAPLCTEIKVGNFLSSVITKWPTAQHLYSHSYSQNIL